MRIETIRKLAGTGIVTYALAAALSYVPPAEAQTPIGPDVLEYCNLIADFGYAVALDRENGSTYRDVRSIVQGGGYPPAVPDLLFVTDLVYRHGLTDPEEAAGTAYTICWDTYGQRT
jgi:hypothetical protein